MQKFLVARLLATGYFFIAIPLYSGVTGKLAGRVVDSETKEALPVVNVVLDGTTMGGATDMDGYYYIINVPVGTYSLTASMIGYKSVMKENLKVSADLTTTVNFAIQPTAIKAKGIIVTAKRPLVIPDATSTMHTMSGDQIDRQPIRSVTEVVSQQSGVVNSAGGASGVTDGLHIRGGRGDEVAYIVDGMSAQDRLTGRSDATVNIHKAALEEISVITGGFNPEYGQAMSGIINVVTKEGRRREGLLRYTTDRISKDPREQDIFELSLGGPIKFHPKLLYFFSAEGSSRDHSTSWYGPLSNTDSESYSLQGKLTYKLTPAMKLKLSGFLSRTQGGSSSHSFKYAPPEFRLDYFKKAHQLVSTLTHQVANNTFYELRLGTFKSRRTDGQREWDKEKDRAWWEDFKFEPWWTYDINNVGIGSSSDNAWDAKDENGDYYYPYGVPLPFRLGSYCSWAERVSAYDGVKFDLTSQVTYHHQIKFGVDGKIHTAKRETAQYIDRVSTVPVTSHGDTIDNEVPPEYRKVKYALYSDEYDYNPKEIAIYLQDKIEYPGFIINGGVRFDYFDPSCWRYNDMLSPYDTLGDLDTVTAKIKYQLSPRFGIAFPVTERTAFHLSYGHFFQVSQFRWLYDSHNINLSTSPGAWPIVSNPDLSPQHTIQYELGIAHELLSNLALNVTGFYKDMYHLIGTRHIKAIPREYTIYQTEDYGNVLGVEFVLRKQATQWFSGQLAYTLQYSRGTSSYTRESYYEYIANIMPDPITGEPPQMPKIDYPLEFDQRHTLNINAGFLAPTGYGPTIFDVHPLERLDINMSTDLGSGLPYTKEDNRGQRIGEVGGERMLWISNTNLKINKPFELFGLNLSFFATINNLFNRKNILNVYPNTGKVDYDGLTQNKDTYLSQTWMVSGDKVEVGYSPSADIRRDIGADGKPNTNDAGEGDGWITKDEWYNSYLNGRADWEKNPSFVNVGRRIHFGIKVNW